MSEQITQYIVTAAAQRPAMMNGKCFYCNQPIGSTHKADCTLIRRKVRVRMTVEYDIEVTASWSGEMIEFHRNDSSWCSNNAIRELTHTFDPKGSDQCMCGSTHYEYLQDTSTPYLDED